MKPSSGNSISCRDSRVRIRPRTEPHRRATKASLTLRSSTWTRRRIWGFHCKQKTLVSPCIFLSLFSPIHRTKYLPSLTLSLCQYLFPSFPVLCLFYILFFFYFFLGPFFPLIISFWKPKPTSNTTTTMSILTFLVLWLLSFLLVLLWYTYVIFLLHLLFWIRYACYWK